MIESDAVVLAAGKQTRYGQHESKLMARIDRQPAFFFTMSSILKVIPEEFVTIISSTLFQDFNDYIAHCYQRAKLVFDRYPGNGSAQSLKSSIPWQSESVFVTEGNIYYESYLISQMFQLMRTNTDLVGVLSATPKVHVASTHRKVVNDGSLDLTGKNTNANQYSRNMGAYVLSNSFQEQINETPDIIEVLNLLNIDGMPIFALNYYGPYLHIETPKDIPSWRSQFSMNGILVD